MSESILESVHKGALAVVMATSLSHSEHGGRVRFSPKFGGCTAPATVVQRGKPRETRVWVKYRPGPYTWSTVGHEFEFERLPIRGGQILDQARRPSTISSTGLSTGTAVLFVHADEGLLSAYSLRRGW